MNDLDSIWRFSRKYRGRILLGFAAVFLYFSAVSCDDGGSRSNTRSLSSAGATGKSKDGYGGSRIIIPDDSDFDENGLTSEEGVGVANQTTATYLTLPGNVTPASKAVAIRYSGEINESAGSLILSLPFDEGGSALTALSTKNLVVFYHTKRPGDGKIVFGVISGSDLLIEAAVVKFRMKGFGTYQVAYMSIVVEQSLEVAEEDIAVNPSSSGASAITQISSTSGSGTSGASGFTSTGSSGGSGSSSGGSGVAGGLQCPDNYVYIPANGDLPTAEFCVMKYEAREVNGTAVSQAALPPWVNIKRGLNDQEGARKACKDIGQGYQLISNAQWQAVARNIESVPENWDWRRLGENRNDVNRINAGHAVLSGSQTICESIIEYVTWSCDRLGGVKSADFPLKRTHVLSDGSVIWDIGGNVAEWVSDVFHIEQTLERFASQSLSPADRLRWGPVRDYNSQVGEPWKGLGMIQITLTGEQPVIRGGSAISPLIEAGIFAVALSQNSGRSNVGFRCVFTGANNNSGAL